MPANTVVSQEMRPRAWKFAEISDINSESSYVAGGRNIGLSACDEEDLNQSRFGASGGLVSQDAVSDDRIVPHVHNYIEELIESSIAPDNPCG
jgi:hypothetical protein